MSAGRLFDTLVAGEQPGAVVLGAERTAKLRVVAPCLELTQGGSVAALERVELGRRLRGGHGDVAVASEEQACHVRLQPWRHGRCRAGTATPAVDAVAGVASPAAAAAGGQLLLDIVADPSEPFDLALDRDEALRIIQGCTTYEARIFSARLICVVLDEAARLASAEKEVA